MAHSCSSGERSEGIVELTMSACPFIVEVVFKSAVSGAVRRLSATLEQSTPESASKLAGSPDSDKLTECSPAKCVSLSASVTL